MMGWGLEAAAVPRHHQSLPAAPSPLGPWRISVRVGLSKKIAPVE